MPHSVYWIHSTVQFGGVHAFGYYSAKVNRFGLNLEHSGYTINWGLAWQILGAIRAVATFEKKQSCFFCPVNNARFHRFPVGQISRDFNTTTSIGDAIKTFEKEFWKFHRKEFFFKKRKHFSQNFNVLRLQAAIPTQWLHIAGNSLPKWSLYGISSFHFYR